jgi:hypothetical protein
MNLMNLEWIKPRDLGDVILSDKTSQSCGHAAWMLSLADVKVKPSHIFRIAIMVLGLGRADSTKMRVRVSTTHITSEKKKRLGGTSP